MAFGTILFSAILFGLAGLAEIGGGWLVWQAVRENAAWWWAIVGGLVLVGYGFIPTLQPLPQFGRLYAAYGGLFIIMSLGWGWVVDKQAPDRWDIIGGAICTVGAVIIIYAPRSA